MPIGRGNFNKKRVSAVKERKVKERVAKKHQAAKQKHNSKKLAVSGQRTGVSSSCNQAAAGFLNSSTAEKFGAVQAKPKRSLNELRECR